MSEDDQTRLRHMLDAAREAVTFANGCERADLNANRLLVMALVKEIEILGEAASRVTEQTQSEIQQIPWKRIVGMRNRLVHAYFDINLDAVWKTVNQDLPTLIDHLEQSIPSRC